MGEEACLFFKGSGVFSVSSSIGTLPNSTIRIVINTAMINTIRIITTLLGPFLTGIGCHGSTAGMGVDTGMDAGVNEGVETDGCVDTDEGTDIGIDGRSVGGSDGFEK